MFATTFFAIFVVPISRNPIVKPFLVLENGQIRDQLINSGKNIVVFIVLTLFHRENINIEKGVIDASHLSLPLPLFIFRLSSIAFDKFLISCLLGLVEFAINVFTSTSIP